MDTQQTIRQQLSALLDGELEAREASRLEELLRADPRLAKELEELRKVRQLVSGLPHEKAPPGLSQRIMASARAARIGRQVQPARARTISLVWGRLAAAAAVVVTVGVGIGIGLNLKQWSGSQSPNAPVAVNADKNRGSTAIARDVAEKARPEEVRKIDKTELAANETDKGGEKIAERIEEGKAAPLSKSGPPAARKGQGDFNKKTVIPNPSELQENQDVVVKSPAAVRQPESPQQGQVAAKAHESTESLEKKLKSLEAEQRKATDTEELACLSANAAQKDVEKLLKENGVEFKADAAAGRVAKDGHDDGQKANDTIWYQIAKGDSNAATETIIYQVSMTQEQYDRIQTGLSRIREDQAVALRAKAEGADGSNVMRTRGDNKQLTNDVLAVADNKHDATAREPARQTPERVAKTAPPPPTATPAGPSGQPAAAARPAAQVMPEQVALADADNKIQQQQRPAGAAGAQSIIAGQARQGSGGGAGEFRASGKPADSPKAAFAAAQGWAATAPATQPATRPAVGQDQAGRRTMTIVLKVVRDPSGDQPPNAQQVPAEADRAPQQNNQK